MATTPLADSLAETLATFRTPGTPMTTTEVADRLDLGRRSTYDRLDRLAGRDLIATKKVGARGRVWWRPIRDPATTATAEPPPARRDHAEQFRTLVEAVEDYAIVMLDVDGRVRTWNEGAARIKGYDREEVVGEDVSTFYTEPDRAAGVPEANLAEAETRGAVEYEGWRVRADGSTFWADVTISAIHDDDESLAGFAKVTRDLTERRASEREIRRERDLLERVMEASPITVGIFDADGDALRVNQRFADLFGLASGAPDEYTLGDQPLLDEAGDVIPYPDRPAPVVLSTGEPLGDERVQVEGADGRQRWLSVNAEPLSGDTEGVVVTMADVTRLEEQSRQLARQRDEATAELERVLDRVDDAFWALDQELRFTYINDPAAELLGYSPSELVGENVWEALPWLEDLSAKEHFEAAMATGQSRHYEDHVEATDRWYEVRVYPSESGLSVYIQEVTERKERERELERYVGIIDAVSEPVYELDAEGRFTFVNDAMVERSGYAESELLGEHVSIGMDDEAVDRVESELVDLLDTGGGDLDDGGLRTTVELDVVTKGGELVPAENRISVRTDEDGGYRGSAGILWDASERIERERELEWYESSVEQVWDGIATLDDEDRFVVVNRAFCEMTGYDREDLLGEPVTLIHSESINEVAARMNRQIVDGDRESATLEFDLETRDGSTIPVEGRFGPIELEPGAVGRTGVVRDVSERKARERELQRQHERLSALNDLNGVVRGITDAVIEQSSREEIERIVCDRLAGTDSYSFAWIGGVDGTERTVKPRVEAGVEGFLEDLTITVDPDDPRSGGPTGRAVIQGELAVAQEVQSGAGHEPWRERLREHGFRSSAAIPIVHDGTFFGVLNVYVDRPHAFSADEQAVVGQLGEVVGHAIAAVERKRALLSNEVVEVEFEVHDVFDADALPRSTDGTVSFDRAVPLGGDSFLVYGTATGDAFPVVGAMVEASEYPHWRSVNVLWRGDDVVRFEAAMERPPLLSSIADYGGRVAEARIEDGDYHLRIHLAPSADVRAVVDAVGDLYPNAVMVSRQQVSRNPAATAAPRGDHLESLTERQRATVETAFFSGYFRWPRESNGPDVAGSLGIDPSTFHHHLREAQRKILGSVLEADAPA